MDYSRYFDNAAATPLLPQAKAAMEPYYNDIFYNPSALYLGARDARIALEEARHSIAKCIGARQTEIIFTAGGTEANNLAVKGILGHFKGSHAITSAIEHDSILEPLQAFNVTIVGVNPRGLIDAQKLANAITDNTVFVSTMYANNEVGAIQPLAEIHAVIEQARIERRNKSNKTPLYWHIDACQASNYLDMQVGRLKVDMMTINAGKVYGPKQTGVLYVRTGVELDPLIEGGGQERSRRSGTENLANIAGFAAAFLKVRDQHQSEARRLSKLRDWLIHEITTNISGGSVNGPAGSKRLANNIHVTFHGKDNERILMELDELGFQVATGSACSASSDEPSHVLKAMGLSDSDARSSIRITLGRYSTDESVQALALALQKFSAQN